MRLTSVIYFLLPLLTESLPATECNRDRSPLFVCYGRIEPSLLVGNELLIIESQHYTKAEIDLIKRQNTKVLAYLSLTEVHETTFFYAQIEPYILGKNTHWNSGYIDIANQNAQKILLTAAETILSKNFDGLFLDNLDNVGQWGSLSGNESALVALIGQLRTRAPKKVLIQNSGLFLVEQLKHHIDAVVLESLVTRYDFEAKTYGLRDTETRKTLTKKIEKTIKKIGKPLYIVEYADDFLLKKKAEKLLKPLGYPYFIANIDLLTKPTFKGPQN